MPTIQKFEDILAWQKARELTNAVYEITRENEFSRDFNLCNQIRRACVSILSNIAEGFERAGRREFLHFLSIAKGSTGEVRAQLFIALDQKYIGQDTFQRLYFLSIEVGKLIGGLMLYLSNKK